MNQTHLIYLLPIPGKGIYVQCKVTFGFKVYFKKIYDEVKDDMFIIYL